MNNSQESGDSIQLHAKAELENVRLENEKLKLEIDEIKKSGNWLNKLAKYTSVLTTLIAVVGLVIGQIQNNQQQKEREKAFERERDRDNAQREQEFRKPFWQKQIDLYFEASDAVSTMANSQDAAKRRQAEEKFWQLFYGELVVVEDTDVEKAMVNIRDYLLLCKESPANCEDYKLKNLSLALSSSCRESIGKSWKKRLEELEGKYKNPGS